MEVLGEATGRKTAYPRTFPCGQARHSTLTAGKSQKRSHWHGRAIYWLECRN